MRENVFLYAYVCVCVWTCNKSSGYAPDTDATVATMHLNQQIRRIG